MLKKITEWFNKTKTENNGCKIEKAKNELEYEWENCNGEIVYLYENVFEDIEGVKFGIEIEFQISEKSIDGNYIINALKNNGILVNGKIVEKRPEKEKYLNWQLMNESTCDWELISPIFEDNTSCWKEIEKVCSILKERLQATVDEHCAIHLHIQREPLLSSGENCVSLMNFYKYLEPFTYAFSAGEESEISLIRVKKYAATLKFADKSLWIKGMSQYEAQEIIRTDDDNRTDYDKLINRYYPTRALGLNFSTKSTENKTVEFRTFNGTLNPIIIQSYLIYTINMINFASQHDVEFDKKYSGEIFGVNEEKNTLNKTYIDKCLHLLFNNKMQRDRVIKPLIRNNYYISQALYEALNGEKYTEEEKECILIIN